MAPASHLFHVKLHPTLTSNVDTSISTNWWICEGILSQGKWIQWFGQKISPKLLPSQASRLLSVLNNEVRDFEHSHFPRPALKVKNTRVEWMFFSDFYLERTTSPPSLHKPYFNLLRFFFSRKNFPDTLLESHPFSCLLPKLPAGNYVLLYLLLPLHTNQGSHKSIAPLLDLVGNWGLLQKDGEWLDSTHKKNATQIEPQIEVTFLVAQEDWTKAREKIHLFSAGLLVDWCQW